MFLRVAVFLCFFCIVAVALFFNAGWLLSCVAGQAVRSDVIVILGSPERIAKGGELYREKFSSRIFLSIPEYLNYFGEQGARPANIAVPNWRPQTTYQEALAFAEYIQKDPVDSAIIVTDPYHQYRVKWTFEHVFRNAGITFTYVSTQPAATLGFWWEDMNSRMFVLTEIPKVLYYWLYHGLLGIETDPEWTIDLKKWYSQKLHELMALRNKAAVWGGAA